MDLAEPSVSEAQRRGLMILNAVKSLGPVSIRRLLEQFGGDARAVLEAGRGDLLAVPGIGPETAEALLGWQQHFDPERELARAAQLGVKLLVERDEGYPDLLRKIHDPPVVLYARGELRPRSPAVGIVGTRKPTQYGRTVARTLGRELAGSGVCVVSGLARGIDSEAHEGALEAGGPTAAVLGCGVDVIYPPENKELYARVARHGVVLSEFTLGRRADKQTFPQRNRIISGLADAVIVVESDSQGGSLITARMAGEQGRQLFAVPGRIDQATARGCNELIRDGATLLTSSEDVLDELRYMPLDFGGEGLAHTRPPPAEVQNLSPVEQQVAAQFAEGDALHADDVAERAHLPLHEVAPALMMLELKRLVSKRHDGKYEGRF